MDLVKDGCVRVNNQTISEPSFDVNPGKDDVFLEGVRIEVKRQEYLLLNKPKGIVTTKKDQYAKHMVMDLLPRELSYLNPVGRLDKDTEGLLLLTNNGELAFRLSHPRFNIDKTYLVEIRGQLKDSDKLHLMKGIILDGKHSAPCKIKNVLVKQDKSQFEITIHEGKKRQIRLMLGFLGYPVLYLKRLSLGPLSLKNLPVGKWRHLTAEEVSSLKSSVGLR